MAAVKTLLIVYHSVTGGTQQMVEAAVQAASTASEVAIRVLRAPEAAAADVLAADGYLFATPENLAAMSDVARANNIHVVLAALTPVCDYHRPQTATRPPDKILELNRWIKQYTASHHYVYLD